MAGFTHKAVTVPRLVLICYSSRSDWILTLYTMFCKFLFMTGDTEDISSLWEEAASPYGLLAVAACEAFLVPGTTLVLNIAATWLDLLVASTAAQGILSVGAFRALNFIVFENKLLIGQRMVTLVTAKAGVMPIPVLVMELLGINPNGFPALSTSVSNDFLKTLHTAVVSILLNILLALQRSSAVMAVKAFRHCAHSVVAGT